MKVLVLGCNGMLGHKMWQVLSQHFDTYLTMRQPASNYSRFEIFDLDRIRDGVDCVNFNNIVKVIRELKPDVVVNCIGIIKQVVEDNDSIYTLTMNSVFPRKLKNLCFLSKIRLIHFSTDCVFSGRKGMYSEEDDIDATDLYGLSKYLGEVDGDNCLTIRTSIIGRELNTQNGLLEWFLSNDGGIVKGYTNAIFSGFPTIVLTEIVVKIINGFPKLSGVWHVSSDPISKYDLLQLIAIEYGLQINIKPFADVSENRSLDSSRFRNETGIIPPKWTKLIRIMKEDPTLFENRRLK